MQNWTDLDPQQFGLNRRIRLRKSRTGEVTLIIDRKSRIIMRDGERILRCAEAVRARLPGTVFSLLTTAPVCRKTIRFLSSHHISVQRSDQCEG